VGPKEDHNFLPGKVPSPGERTSLVKILIGEQKGKRGAGPSTRKRQKEALVQLSSGVLTGKKGWPIAGSQANWR